MPNVDGHHDDVSPPGTDDRRRQVDEHDEVAEHSAARRCLNFAADRRRVAIEAGAVAGAEGLSS